MKSKVGILVVGFLDFKREGSPKVSLELADWRNLSAYNRL